VDERFELPLDIVCRSGTESSQTPRWREMDSNHLSLMGGAVDLQRCLGSGRSTKCPTRHQLAGRCHGDRRDKDARSASGAKLRVWRVVFSDIAAKDLNQRTPGASLATIAAPPPPRNQKFADSPLEGVDSNVQFRGR